MKDISVKPLDVLGMELSDIDSLLEGVLQEFPLGSICIEMPEWMRALGTEHFYTRLGFEKLGEYARYEATV